MLYFMLIRFCGGTASSTAAFCGTCCRTCCGTISCCINQSIQILTYFGRTDVVRYRQTSVAHGNKRNNNKSNHKDKPNKSDPDREQQQNEIEFQIKKISASLSPCSILCVPRKQLCWLLRYLYTLMLFLYTKYQAYTK